MSSAEQWLNEWAARNADLLESLVQPRDSRDFFLSEHGSPAKAGHQ